MPKSERGALVKSLVLEKLPEDNYTVLKFIIHFLAKVRPRAGCCQFYVGQPAG